jgi:hypothetical protein
LGLPPQTPGRSLQSSKRTRAPLRGRGKRRRPRGSGAGSLRSSKRTRPPLRGRGKRRRPVRERGSGAGSRRRGSLLW